MKDRYIVFLGTKDFKIKLDGVQEICVVGKKTVLTIYDFPLKECVKSYIVPSNLILEVKKNV